MMLSISDISVKVLFHVLDEVHRVAGDHEFLIGADHRHLDLGVRQGDEITWRDLLGGLMLRSGNDVGQMMKVVGEEGTSLADFAVYLKSEFLDTVYLQQNAFSDVDASTPEERQKIMFDVVEKALFTEYKFTTNDEARAFFMSLQQAFIDWNDKPFDSDEFKTLKETLVKKIEEASA